jgi:predicted Zn finger-like uncharacterized protein
MIIQCPSCAARYRVDIAQTDKAVARVKCPKCRAAFEVSMKPAASTPTAKAPVGPVILVVDDARFFRDVMLDILQPLQGEILTAADGEEALQIIRRSRPQLVILDLKLPKFDGYQLIRAVRSDPALANVKLLAMSGVYREKEEMHRVLLAGADDFLNKSFKPEHLLDKIKRMLNT